MPAPPPDARSLSAEVERVTPCGDDGVVLALRPEVELPPVRASRFFMLRRPDRLSPLIPRPFSLYRQRGDVLEFLVKVMGRGTRALAASRPGDELTLVGPLGNGWPALAGGGAPWVMLAGGVGSAPFFLGLEQALAGMDGKAPARRDELVYLFGAARRGLLYDLERFRALGVRVHTATDDGSEGFRGNVLQLFEELQRTGELPRTVRLLACGPHPMLVAVERLARAQNLECWLSLETLMGCGVGICNGCPVATRPEGALGAWPNAKCCVEGRCSRSARSRSSSRARSTARRATRPRPVPPSRRTSPSAAARATERDQPRAGGAEGAGRASRSADASSSAPTGRPACRRASRGPARARAPAGRRRGARARAGTSRARTTARSCRRRARPRRAGPPRPRRRASCAAGAARA
jgi:dihydroorotate dehydrogenase electron transfer subunit